MKSRTLIAFGIVVAAAISGFAAAPAFADGGAAIVGSQTYWVSSTKTLSSTDSQADGMSSIAQLRRGTSGAISEVVNSSGKNQTRSVKVSVTAGSTIYLRACVQNLSTGGARSCGDWVKKTA